jgi:hypothetical protein
MTLLIIKPATYTDPSAEFETVEDFEFHYDWGHTRVMIPKGTRCVLATNQSEGYWLKPNPDQYEYDAALVSLIECQGIYMRDAEVTNDLQENNQ